MSFHRGGIVGVFDQLSSYLHERAKRERFELKQAKSGLRLESPSDSRIQSSRRDPSTEGSAP